MEPQLIKLTYKTMCVWVIWILLNYGYYNYPEADPKIRTIIATAIVETQIYNQGWE